MTGKRCHRIMSAIPIRVVIVLLLVFVALAQGDAQTRRHIKVLLNSQQTENVNREAVQGSGSVVIRRGTVNPSGSIIANERQTNVKRTSGIFTLVLDGSESILSVATRVPRNQIGFYQNYALGTGYIERQIVFEDVGTSLRVNALILPDGQIKLRLTPRISYFSVQRPGAIDFTEAATELVVPDGQPVSLGGLTRSLHEVTRQILGYGGRSSGSETELTVTATIQ
jgi:type II secretory pathway component GspD/PulD (secretin)